MDTKIQHMLQALQFIKQRSIKQRLYRTYDVCIFIYKILNNTLPVALRNGTIGVSDNERQTRWGILYQNSAKLEGAKEHAL